MDPKEHDEFLCRIAKTLYYGNTSFDTVSLPLTELAAELFNEVKKENSLERLGAQEVAEIHENACVSTCSLVLAILYLEKIKSLNPEYVEKVAPSELFLVSLLIASKFLNDDGDDDSVTNYEWAVCSGLPLKTVNRIEKEFLNAINWEVYIAKKQFWTRLKKMERYLAIREGKRRGWYSYTEFNVLVTGSEMIVLKEILKFSAMCMTCYATTVLSLIGTALLAIRVKYFLLNCILFVLMKETINNNQTCVTSTASTLTLNTELNMNETSQIVADLTLEVPANVTSDICDLSFIDCFNSSISFKSFSFNLNIQPRYKSLRYIFDTKFNAFQKNSLFQSYNQWPDF